MAKTYFSCNNTTLSKKIESFSCDHMESEKRSLLKKTLQVGSLTFLSRGFGLVRDILQAWFLGIGPESDAFLTAFRIPNMFRQIFAEGALSAALIPYLTRMKHEGRSNEIGSLLSMVTIILGSIVAILCIVIVLCPGCIIEVFAPGFKPDQIAFTSRYLSIMFPFIFIVFLCAILTAALQAVNHFFTPALAPVLFNITLIVALITGIYYSMPVEWLCYAVLASGLAKLLPRFLAFKYKNLSFGHLTKKSWNDFKHVIIKVGPCLAGVGVYQINILLDTVVASYLPRGQLTILHYAYRFMHAPLAVLGIATSVTFLPYFSRMALQNKERLRFCLTEVVKVLVWAAVPVSLFLMFTSKLLFEVLFSEKATGAQIILAKNMLIILAFGIAILSINRVMVRLFYALQDTKTPTWTFALTTALKIAGNIFSITVYGGIYGIVTATIAVDLLATPALLILLARKHNVAFDFSHFLEFFRRFLPQLALSIIAFLSIYSIALYFLPIFIESNTKLFYGAQLTIASILLASIMLSMLLTRKKCKLNLYFLEK